MLLESLEYRGKNIQAISMNGNALVPFLYSGSKRDLLAHWVVLRSKYNIEGARFGGPVSETNDGDLSP